MIGQTFLKQYVIASELGQGSMGRVFLAKGRQGQEVVIKLMDPRLAKQERFRRQFQEELDCMRRLQHPGAVTLLAGTLDDPLGPGLVMEHVRGQDLEVLRKQQPLRRFPPARVGLLIGQVCQVLQVAHQHGILHRDLKPSNLMVVAAGQAMERIKVIDFGLAKWVEDFRDLARPTGTAGRLTGSPAYSSPEQIRGQAADPRSDLYSVGVILFELLTGKLPFRKSTAAETLQAHLREMPPRFATIDPALNMPALEAVVQICLAKEPSGRPNGAQDLAQRLEQALGQRSPEVQAPPAVRPAPVPAPRVAAPPPAPVRSAAPPVQRGRPTSPGTAAAPPAQKLNAVPRPAAAAPAPVEVQRGRPTSPGTAPAPLPIVPTFHELRPDADGDGAIGGVPGFRPNPRTLNTLAGFVRDAGGKLVENNPDSMRALLPINLNPSVDAFARGGFSSGSVQLVLTEMELSWEPRRAEQTLRLAFRPLASVSYSLVSAWRGGCDRLQARLQELVGQA
jgi:serine/threonine-protein kinase